MVREAPCWVKVFRAQVLFSEMAHAPDQGKSRQSKATNMYIGVSEVGQPGPCPAVLLAKSLVFCKRAADRDSPASPAEPASQVQLLSARGGFGPNQLVRVSDLRKYSITCSGLVYSSTATTMKLCGVFGTTKKHAFDDFTTKVAGKCSDCKAADASKTSGASR